jgi:hypothetical protein
MTYDDEDESFGLYDGECQVCGLFGRVDDLILCEECAGKLDRDLIRLRDWDYSVAAFGVPASKHEELRGQVVAQYGEELELIAPKEKKKNTNTRKKGAVKSDNLSLQRDCKLPCAFEAP